MAKIVRNLYPIVANALYMVLPGLVNQLLALYVISGAGNYSWGQIVEWQLYYYLTATIISWGNKEFLLREFSRDSSGIHALWEKALVSRFVFLLLPLVVLTLVYYPFEIGIHIALWLVFRFISQSVEAIITFQKKYKVALCSETAAMLPLLVVWLTAVTNVPYIALVIVTLSHALRSIYLLVAYRAFFYRLSYSKPQFSYLSLTGAFMLISVAVFLQSKIDLYCISSYGDKVLTGEYQVLMSYVSLVFLLPAFLIVPYTKHIYRFNRQTIKQKEKELLGIGVLVAAGGVGVLFVIIEYLYKIQFETITYLLCAVCMLLPFVFTLKGYNLYKNELQNQVMLIAFLSMAINGLLCFMLIPVMQINGAVVAVLGGQFFLWLSYSYKERNI